MSARSVTCVKLKQDLPGLEKPPFAGELGEQIFNNVSAEAWAVWKNEMMIKIINEYRLDLSDSDQYNVLMEQMKAFLNLDGGDMLEVENEQRGKQS